MIFLNNNQQLKRFILFLLSSLCITQLFAEQNRENAPPVNHQPNYSAYKELEKFIPFYVEATKNPWPTIDMKQVLRFGIKDNAVIALRKRLQRTGELSASTDKEQGYFDKPLEKAVRIFQERHGILMDGIVGKRTLTALNIPPKKRLHQIYVNIQRWKDFSSQIVPQYIWINVPDYFLRFVDDHKTNLIARVIVGKPTRITPEIDSDITHVTLNPYWIVPPGIARKDVIPKAMANPEYLRQQRIRVFLANDMHTEIPLNKIQWSAVAQNLKSYRLRQDSGPKNALGQIKFEFANRHLIYLHDTPAKKLFDEEKRLFSSGCIRLENPLHLFAKIAERDKAIKKQIPLMQNILSSGRTATFKLARPIPIRITYITVWVDEHGVLHFLDDVYKQDHYFSYKTPHKSLPSPL